jgi:hypothetical protein
LLFLPVERADLEGLLFSAPVGGVRSAALFDLRVEEAAGVGIVDAVVAFIAAEQVK